MSRIYHAKVTRSGRLLHERAGRASHRRVEQGRWRIFRRASTLRRWGLSVVRLRAVGISSLTVGWMRTPCITTV
jgi:hypothetical protein